MRVRATGNFVSRRNITHVPPGGPQLKTCAAQLRPPANVLVHPQTSFRLCGWSYSGNASRIHQALRGSGPNKICTWCLCPLSLADHQSIEGALPTARLLYISECALNPSHHIMFRHDRRVLVESRQRASCILALGAIPPDKGSQKVRAQENVKHTKLLPLHLMYTAVFPKLRKMLDPCDRSSRRE